MHDQNGQEGAARHLLSRFGGNCPLSPRQQHLGADGELMTRIAFSVRLEPLAFGEPEQRVLSQGDSIDAPAKWRWLCRKWLRTKQHSDG
jgi:hypothetical protein